MGRRQSEAAPETLEIWLGFRTSVLAFNGSVPSPTIRVKQGQEFAARIENRLVDNLVVHWHGIIAPPAMDGHPRDAVSPGQDYAVKFPIRQRVGTYFYHPHTEPLTGKPVYLGLAAPTLWKIQPRKRLGSPRMLTMCRCSFRTNEAIQIGSSPTGFR
jgi:FtsP/CotA-like multicopper oxidase with cupredoxin domain